MKYMLTKVPESSGMKRKVDIERKEVHEGKGLGTPWVDYRIIGGGRGQEWEKGNLLNFCLVEEIL